MKIFYLSICCLISASAAITFFAYRHKFFIVYTAWPTSTKNGAIQKAQEVFIKKDCFFFHQEEWHSEQITLLSTDDSTLMLRTLISQWLEIMKQEGCMKQSTRLESAVIASPSMIAYLSFEDIPFERQQSIQEKWHWMESLLKTIREAHLKVQAVHILVNHQSLEDVHLDFSYAWPIQGFSSNAL